MTFSIPPHFSAYFILCNIVIWSFVACMPEPTGEQTKSPLLERPAEQNVPAASEDALRSHWQNPDLVIEQLGDIEDQVIADIGAGTGYFTYRLLPYARQVIAIDIDPRMTDFIAAHALSIDSALRSRLDVRVAEMDDPMIQPDEVDIAFLSNTYAYITDRVDYFTRLRPRLRPGARVVIVDFKKKRIPVHNDPASRLPLYQVEDELTDAGYELLLSDDQSLPYQYILIARVP